MPNAFLPGPNDEADYRRDLARAKLKAFRFPKGTSGAQGTTQKFYQEARRLARYSAPAIMKEMIDLALTCEDPRVKSVCGFAVLDRAGVKPIDFDPNEGKEQRAQFDPSDYTPEELDVLEAAFKLMVAREKEKKQAVVAGSGAVLDGEIIPPEK